MNDWEELRRYASDGSEEAFGCVVNRHIGLVYSAAFRQAGDEQMARDITQMVFANLARRAKSLRPEGTLAGWLHRDTRFTALELLRKNRRRLAREQEAVMMQEPVEDSAADWSRIRPSLDAALDQLNRPDRDALLLRFFEQRTWKEVGAALGIDEDAARKRVSRAMEKLRGVLQREGISASSGILSLALTTHALQTAPAGLAALVLSSSLAAAGSAAGTGAAWALIETITMTKIKTSVAAVMIAAGVGTPLLLQHSENKKLREENSALIASSERLGELQAENEELKEAARARANLAGPEFAELLRLRGEVGLLRRQTNEMAGLRQELEQLRAAARVPADAGPRDAIPPVDLASARDVIFDPAAGIGKKLEALRVLRFADARSDEVVRQMVQVYYATENPNARADIFRQLHGMTTPELKRPLLEAVSDANAHSEIREEAAETLDSFLHDPDVKAWLEHLAAEDPNPKLREQASRSLQRRQDSN